MDEFKSVQATPQVQFNKPGFFQSLWGKLTIFLASAILLAAATAALNYFHILPLSQKFSFLSFLPTKQIQTIKQNNTIAQTSSQVTQVEIPPGVTKISQIFVNQHLTSSYQTEVILKKGIFTQKGKTIELPSSFGYRWQVEGVSVNFSNQWGADKQKPLNLNLTLSVPKTTTPISNSNVATMIAKYIQPPKNLAWDCGQANVAGIIQCHSMKTQADETRLGVSYTTNTKDNLEDLITICQNYPGSNTYTWKTCLYE